MRSSLRLGALPIPIILFVSAVTAQDTNGLKIDVTKKVDCTRKTHDGDTIHVNYRGTLQSDGSQFDSSYGRTPFSFVLGGHQVIAGWDLGLLNMCPGEARNLTIPPKLAYGDRGVGSIPGGATLIFETELISIDGVEEWELVDKPEPAGDDTTKDTTTETTTDTEPTVTEGEEITEAMDKGSEKGPKDEGDKEPAECKLLGPFALLVQGALGCLALLSLVWKRYRETPRRPLKVWAFDASKQVLGSMLLHLANLLMSMLSSGELDINQKAKMEATFVQDDKGRQPNPCSFYLLNLAIDTTIGIPILVGLLRLLHLAFSYTALASPPGSLNSGNYGRPPKTTWWLKQSFVYFLGLLGMKLCVFFLFHLLPWLGWVGDWALRWTEGKEWMQILFVMLVFPLIMNAMQYYIIDSFIKDSHPEDYQQVDGDEQEDDENEGLIRAGGLHEDDDSLEGSFVIDEEGRKVPSARLKEANPMALPVYDEDRDGAESSSPGRSVRDEGGKEEVNMISLLEGLFGLYYC